MSAREREEIHDFVTTRLARKSEHRTLSDDEDLIAAGVVDSLGIMNLIAYLERTFAIRIRDDEIVPENFASIDAITSFVVHRR